ncbi:hypothetical protein ACWD4B_04690 [Streptomyces sp. NPDC002536]
MNTKSRALNVASAAILLLIPISGTAAAGNFETGPTNAATVTTGSSLGPDDRVTCTIKAARPNYSGTTITAVGWMSSCRPHAPQTCRTETDLLRYYPGPGMWQVVASGPVNYSCPGPSRVSTAVLRDCESNPVNWSYVTRTYSTIIQDGIPTSGHVDSDLLNVRCV